MYSTEAELTSFNLESVYAGTWYAFLWDGGGVSTLAMWKFPGQGSNVSHNSDPNCCSDNTRFLADCATREICDMPSFGQISFCTILQLYPPPLFFLRQTFLGRNSCYLTITSWFFCMKRVFWLLMYVRWNKIWHCTFWV